VTVVREGVFIENPAWAQGPTASVGQKLNRTCVMLIDRHLPRYDVTEVCSIEVDASWPRAYAAIREADLRDPVVDALFALRDLPLRILRAWHGEDPPAERPITFGSMVSPDPGWMILDEIPGIELVVGSVGQFWRRDYGWRKVEAPEFREFAEPGYAKLVVSLAVLPAGPGRTTIRYEARTATTDEAARRKFIRYWRLIHPGVALVMRRALKRIKSEAEALAPVAA
jgi:hypothetical protein